MLPHPVEKRVQLALDALKKIYPKSDIAGHIIGDPITVSWEADPHFLGAFKGALPGHYRYNQRMYAHFMQDDMPAEQRGIFIAGDDVSWTPAWVEGAVQTSLNAVWGIMNHFGGATHPRTRARAMCSTRSALSPWPTDCGPKASRTLRGSVPGRYRKSLDMRVAFIKCPPAPGWPATCNACTRWPCRATDADCWCCPEMFLSGYNIGLAGRRPGRSPGRPGGPADRLHRPGHRHGHSTAIRSAPTTVRSTTPCS